MTSPEQVVVWTALPTGWFMPDGSPNQLFLSAFVAPQFTFGSVVTDVLSSTDFSNWPQLVGSSATEPVTFTVTLSYSGKTVQVPATIVTEPPPSGVDPTAAWSAVFDADRTAITPYASFPDYGSYGIESFPATEVTAYIQSLYTQMAQVALVNPILLSTIRGNFTASSTLTGKTSPAMVFEALADLVPTDGFSPRLTQQQAMQRLWAFHTPLPDQNPGYVVPTPTIDFNTGLSTLGSYPAILRLLGLVFDLSIEAPDDLAFGDLQVMVTPTWKSSLPVGTSVDFTPWTATTFSEDFFLPAPSPSSPDYANGMLDLSDGRFSLTDLDMDLAGDRLGGLSLALQSAAAQVRADIDARSVAYGDSQPTQMAMTLPALKSGGMQVLWNGYSGAPFAGVAGRIAGQTALIAQLRTWLADQTAANLPILHAEDLVRGHRFDVYTASEATPAWWTLCGRQGLYNLGPFSSSPIKFNIIDEGTVTPGASSPTGTTSPPPNLLRVHEAILRWQGWGLAVQRPGAKLALDDSGATPNTDNLPVEPPASGSVNPQFSAFSVPTGLTYPDLRFPPLRFGSSYRFRARAVDLAGNSIQYTSTDDSTATPVYPHFRYEPVRPPALCGIAPFTTGESTHFLVLLNDMIDPVRSNGRWLFPPQVAQLMAERHGCFDGFSPGQPPNPADGPNPDSTTYETILSYDGQNLGDVRTDFTNPTSPLIGTYDAGNRNVPYFTGNPLPYTPWLSDPISAGPAFAGLPGLGPNVAVPLAWSGVWPAIDPILLSAQAGTTSVPPSYKPAQAGEPPTLSVTLVPAEAAVVRVSSAITDEGLATLGVWPWIASTGDAQVLEVTAREGRAWMLSPYQVVRMVHAVRLPLTGPQFGSPFATRTAGATSADITDNEFVVEPRSTSHVDITGTWIDPVDNVLEAGPGVVASSGEAFRLTIPDPSPNGPESSPMRPVTLPAPFALAPSGTNYLESATQHFGDTIHHTVEYTATGTSRFAELFTQTVSDRLTVGTPFAIGSSTLGLTGGSVTISASLYLISHDGTPEWLQPGTDFTVDVAALTVTILATPRRAAGLEFDCKITYQPATTLAGPAVPVEILASTRPSAPVVSEVVAAWQIAGPDGTLAGGGIELARAGGFLRVYLERPWFSSGAGEMLGVVTTTVAQDQTASVFPSTQQQGFVTMMGLDPINYVKASASPWPTVPTSFTNLANVPHVPYREPYASPPALYLVEDDSQTYDVWPYEVNYDPVTRRWFADVCPNAGVTPEGGFSPPPGYFIRLALCRFQPYSEQYAQGSTIEVSPVVLATFAQPVPDRTVSVLPNTGDTTGESVFVTITGPGYSGWRPPVASTYQVENVGKGYDFDYDGNNPYAPQNPSIYGGQISNTFGKVSTSTMVVQVQIQGSVLTKEGFEGDLAWELAGDTETVVLKPTFTDGTLVAWGGSNPQLSTAGLVKLPQPVSGSVKMRLRISELDYYTGTGAPAEVNTSLRRPFVCLIPIN